MRPWQYLLVGLCGFTAELVVCRYLVPPSSWIHCALESQELMRICLKRLRGLSRVHLVDAGFVWTEPHSKRIKVKLTVQKEVHARVSGCCGEFILL